MFLETSGAARRFPNSTSAGRSGLRGRDGC